MVDDAPYWQWNYCLTHRLYHRPGLCPMCEAGDGEVTHENDEE